MPISNMDQPLIQNQQEPHQGEHHHVQPQELSDHPEEEHVDQDLDQNLDQLREEHLPGPEDLTLPLSPMSTSPPTGSPLQYQDQLEDDFRELWDGAMAELHSEQIFNNINQDQHQANLPATTQQLEEHHHQVLQHCLPIGAAQGQRVSPLIYIHSWAQRFQNSELVEQILEDISQDIQPPPNSQ